MAKELMSPKLQMKHPYFAEKLIAQLRVHHIQITPTKFAAAFNNHYKNTIAKPHTVRKWLLGQTRPKSETLLLLSNWLKVDPKDLISQPSDSISLPNKFSFEFDFTDQEVIAKYLSMTVKQKVTVRLLIDAIADKNQ